jgi:hypothetical protein
MINSSNSKSENDKTLEAEVGRLKRINEQIYNYAMDAIFKTTQ